MWIENKEGTSIALLTFGILYLPFKESSNLQVQGDHAGQRLGFVDFNLDVPLSAQFCMLGQLQSGQKWHRIELDKIKVNKT